MVIQWKTPFAEAAAPELTPYPRHLLKELLAQDSLEAWENHPYWTTAYVGPGPYRLERWERGAFMDGVAFDGYALGQPKIHRIRLGWSDDPNVALTRLLSGAADAVLDNAMYFQQATILKQRWTSESMGTVLLNPASLRYIQVQARPDYANPRALLEVPVRRAIMHAIDRQALTEAVLQDISMVAEGVVPPTVPYYAEVDRVVRKYPFDPKRAEQLMGEAGFAKGSDGVFTSPSEGRFRLEVRAREELDSTIVTSYLQRAGMAAELLLMDERTRNDNEIKGSYPGLSLNENILQRGLGLDKFYTPKIGRPENRWIGVNRMGYSNPVFDRLWDAYTKSLETTEQHQLMVDMARVLSEDLPGLPLFFDAQVIAHSAAIRGPQPITPDNSWHGNVREWEWR